MKSKKKKTKIFVYICFRDNFYLWETMTNTRMILKLKSFTHVKLTKIDFNLCSDKLSSNILLLKSNKFKLNLDLLLCKWDGIGAS